LYFCAHFYDWLQYQVEISVDHDFSCLRPTLHQGRDCNLAVLLCELKIFFNGSAPIGVMCISIETIHGIFHDGAIDWTQHVLLKSRWIRLATTRDRLRVHGLE